MKTKLRSTEYEQDERDRDKLAAILAANDWLVFVIAAVLLILLVMGYFDIGSRPNIDKMVADFIKSTITSLIPIPLLFVISYSAYRRIESIRSQTEFEFLSKKLADKVVAELQSSDYGGIVRVHPDFPNSLFKECIKSSKTIIILNTWIPNIDSFEKDLVHAINNNAKVYILMLYPNSGIADLRNDALELKRRTVRGSVEECLSILKNISGQIRNENKRNLRVRLYNSLPSISVYAANERLFVSVFFHKRLAVNSPQIEVQYVNSTLGVCISEEIHTLWNIGQEISNIEDYETEVSNMAPRFKTPQDWENIL
jgi:hypothetical protein